MAAIKTFRELVAGGAYNFMNVNQVFVNNFNLLKQAYEHYVHYTWVNNYSKEKKEKGKLVQDEERKLLQTACERVTTSHSIII